jgi:hypothetical protein
MKQHLELGIIVAMSAMMVFGAAAFVMPFVYAASGGSGTSGASGASGSSGGAGGAGGKGTNPGSTTTGGSSTGGSSTGGSSTGGSSTGGSHPTTNPPPKNPPPKNPPPKPCVPGKCLGTPGYYTTNGHHHCYDGAAGCKCTDPHKCTVGSAFIRPDSIMTTV